MPVKFVSRVCEVEMAFNRPSRPELYNEERKMQIYNFITDYINEYGVSPSIPEMADEFHVSKATIHKYLVRLQDQGYIERFGKNQMTTKETLFNVANIPIVGKELYVGWHLLWR